MVETDDMDQDDGRWCHEDDEDEDDDSQHPPVPIEQLRPEIQRQYMLNKDVDNNDSSHDKDARETVPDQITVHLFLALRKRI